jgi:hypothetical protein
MRAWFGVARFYGSSISRIGAGVGIGLCIGLVMMASACAIEDQGAGGTASREHGLVASNGMQADNGLYADNALRFDDGVLLQDGESLSHGLAAGHGLSVAHGLATEAGLSSTTGFLTSEAGQELVRYLVECALPLGHGITKSDPMDGDTITFDGIVGLAPEWETGACDQDCQEWVSACLLARTNAVGQSVSIELVASHPAIGSRRSQPLLYLFEEAGFHGNLFLDPPQAHACMGTGAILSALQMRLCGLVPLATCGFDGLVDACFLLDECSGRDRDAYVGCRNAAGTRQRTITTYTKLL